MMVEPRWRRYLRFWRDNAAADVDDELALHFELLTRDLEARGLPHDEARRRAVLLFGDAAVVRDACVGIERDRRRQRSRAEAARDMGSDLRFTLRALRRAPGFAVMAIVCVALGISATTTIFSAVNAILIRPLPYPDADRLLAIHTTNVALGYHGIDISYKDYVSWRDDNHTFSAVGIWGWVTKTISEGESERVLGASVSANLFPLLGIRPILGRNFLPEEEHLGRSDVVLLSYGVWQRRYGGDSSIVGRTISMDGRPHLVAGVMPQKFNFPDRGEFWMPFAYDGPARESHGDRGYAGAIGRLRPGATIEQAKTDLALVSERLQRQFPQDNTGWTAEPTTLREDLTGDLRRPLLIFLAAVGLVLLIACANVANLMLARGATRYREMAVRSALGAARSRLLRQLLTESLVIAAIGGVIGAVIGVWAVRFARFAFPNDVPFYFDFGLDAHALLFAAGIIATTGILFGILPAFRAARIDINRALRDGERSSAAVGRARIRGLLVVGELALSTVLMIGALLLIRSYRAFTETDLGFERHGILTARLTLPENTYDGSARRIAFFSELEARVRAIPGVSMVGSAQGIPFSGWNVQGQISFFGRPPVARNEVFLSHFQTVFPDFFPAMGIRLARGRMLTNSDRDTLAPAAVVNETFARRAFPGSDAVGQRVKLGSAASSEPWYTIVGVVRDFRHYQLPQPMGPALYTTYYVLPSRSQTLTIRTTARDPYTLAAPLRAAVRAVNPQLALYDMKTVDDAVSRSLWRQRLQGQVLGLFAALALILSAVGVYGVIAYSVTQRRREIGVRIALGAKRRDVLALVLSQGARIAFVGIGVGLVAALVLSRMVESLLYGISRTDAASYLSVGLGLTIVALAAAYVPAARAARVDPALAMRPD